MGLIHQILTFGLTRRQWSTKNWRFEEWFSKTLKNNTITGKNSQQLFRVERIVASFLHIM